MKGKIDKNGSLYIERAEWKAQKCPFVTTDSDVDHASMTTAPAESLSGHSLNLLNYKNMETSVSTLPEPTFHVGKINFYMI